MNENRLFQQIRNRIKESSFSVLLPNGRDLKFGKSEPSFTVKINNEDVLSAFMSFDELRFAEAYINGNLDVEGDMWGFVSCRWAVCWLIWIPHGFPKVHNSCK